MGCMLRSDPMVMCDMYLQPEAAFEVLSNLGEMGCVQFIDMNPELQAFQRNYVVEVCRFAEMERKLRYILAEMKTHNIPVYPHIGETKAAPLHEMIEFENILEKWEQDLLEITQNEISLMKSFLELNEFAYVLTHMGPLLGDAELKRTSFIAKFSNEKKRQCTKKNKKQVPEIAERMSKLKYSRGMSFAFMRIVIGAPAGGDIPISGGRLIVIAGVVQRAKCHAFEMMLWRISHGNLYYKQASDDRILTDPNTRQEIRKVAFLSVCQGKALAIRVQKICDGFRVNTYPCPYTYKERLELTEKLEYRMIDLDLVLKKTQYLRCKNLRSLSKQWQSWMYQVRKAKAIYHTLNLFSLDITKKCIIGQCWVPESDLEEVNKMLSTCSASLQSNVPSFTSTIDTIDMPPTYHRTNKFTHGFQMLINAYGDSTYRELNPGLYTLITFPFLFAMMFGDIGHGMILALFGTWMWYNEKKFANVPGSEIWNIFFGGRYVILMMGVFSMFTGFIYNDCFAKTFALRKSYWINTLSVEELAKSDYVDVDPAGETYEVYPYGKDPIWSLAKNKIMYENSLKMKLSIIVGIIHMMFGITLSMVNHIYFKRYYAIPLQFVPELLILVLLFFWLVVLIYLKWIKYTAKAPDPDHNTACAPQILILFIDMALVSETKPVSEDCKKAYMFDCQKDMQRWLVFGAVLCIPILLLGTPLYKHKINKRKKIEIEKELALARHDSFTANRDLLRLAVELEKYSLGLGELMIHQGVHTIEFVLSTISHTASYLRLWALSLAHSQLSEMLWTMILSKLALHDYTLFGGVRLYFIFAVWAAFTVCILVVMEGLSAFLHCLRLHWVEFMSKFYSGGGYPFKPFSFRVILATEGEKSEPGCKKQG